MIHRQHIKVRQVKVDVLCDGQQLAGHAAQAVAHGGHFHDLSARWVVTDREEEFSEITRIGVRLVVCKEYTLVVLFYFVDKREGVVNAISMDAGGVEVLVLVGLEELDSLSHLRVHVPSFVLGSLVTLVLVENTWQHALLI